MRTRTAPEPVTCATCRAPYRPALTGWSCPVCDTPAPGQERRPGRRLADPDDRLLGIVLVATIANVLLLAVLAIVAVRVTS